MAKKRPATPSVGSEPTTSASTSTVSSSDVHAMLVAVAIMLAVVLGLTAVADVSNTGANLALLLLAILLFLQGINHTNPLVSWLIAHPVTPGGSSLTTTGASSS